MSLVNYYVAGGRAIYVTLDDVLAVRAFVRNLCLDGIRASTITYIPVL